MNIGQGDLERVGAAIREYLRTLDRSGIGEEFDGYIDLMPEPGMDAGMARAAIEAYTALDLSKARTSPR